MKLDGARTLLTGASGGIGHAIAKAMSARGTDMVLTGRRVEVLESLATEVGECAAPVDLADRTALRRLIDEVGDVDVLIASAALPASGLLTTFTDEEIDHALDANLRAR
jgi:NADP-dependent 3-hydroxy acid dehydrogenase YdfG